MPVPVITTPAAFQVAILAPVMSCTKVPAEKRYHPVLGLLLKAIEGAAAVPLANKEGGPVDPVMTAVEVSPATGWVCATMRLTKDTMTSAKARYPTRARRFIMLASRGVEAPAQNRVGPRGGGDRAPRVQIRA